MSGKIVEIFNNVKGGKKINSNKREIPEIINLYEKFINSGLSQGEVLMILGFNTLKFDNKLNFEETLEYFNTKILKTLKLMDNLKDD